MGEWAHGLLGCFDDFATCIMTWILPCVTFGYLAEAAGTADSCFIGALYFFVPLMNLYCLVKTRQAIREQHGIQDSALNDVVVTLCCGIFSLVQQAQQIKLTPGASVART